MPPNAPIIAAIINATRVLVLKENVSFASIPIIHTARIYKIPPNDPHIHPLDDAPLAAVNPLTAIAIAVATVTIVSAEASLIDENAIIIENTTNITNVRVIETNNAFIIGLVEDVFIDSTCLKFNPFII